jgi:hypothetical protein
MKAYEEERVEGLALYGGVSSTSLAVFFTGKTTSSAL